MLFRKTRNLKKDMSDKRDIQSFLGFFLGWRKTRFDYLGGFLCQCRSEIKILKHYGNSETLWKAAVLQSPSCFHSTEKNM